MPNPHQFNGFRRPLGGGSLDVYVSGTLVASFDDAAPYFSVASGFTVTAGGLTITAGGLRVTSGRVIETLTAADLNAQNGTLTVAQIVGGILLYTSVTGGGTLTTDTALAIIGGDSGVGALTANGQAITCYVINDGDQTVTLQGGTDVTIADTGNTILINESAILLFHRTSSTAVMCYIIGA